MRLGALLGVTLGVWGFDVALAAKPDTSGHELLLEVWINGRNRHVVVPATERDGALLIAAGALDEIGIKSVPDARGVDGLVDIARLPGLSARVDDHDQSLHLTVPTAQLTPEVVDLSGGAARFHHATAGTGLLLDYDTVITAVDHGDALSAGGTLSATGFTSWGEVTASGFGTTGAGGDQLTRLDMNLVIDSQRSLTSWVFGDAVSGGLSWSRPVRFGGLHVGTDYSLQPEFITQPLPQFFGQTTVPAAVDVFVNAAKVSETRVEPGPFEIRNLPVVTGGGTAQVVIRDELGRETVRTIPFYSTPQMLAAKLFAYSLDIGMLRRSYGERSFDYGKGVAEATARYGLSQQLTLEAHAEAASDIVVAGGGAVLALPPFGFVHAAAAASTAKQGTGSLVEISGQSQTHPLNLFASFRATSENYADVGTIDASAPPRQRFQAGANLSLGRRSSVSVSWIDIRSRSGEPVKLATASYAFSLGGGLFFGVTGIDDVTTGDLSTEAFLSIPLGDGTTAGTSIQNAGNITTGTASLAHPANPDGGFGYRAMGSIGRQDVGEADATFIGTHGRVDAGVSTVDGRTAVRAGASGAIVAMDGGLFATHTSDDAFAVVRTGEPNIEIYHENRPIAVSDAKGQALVPDLNAYERNLISVEPRDYPMSKVVEDSERLVVPRRRSGVTVDFSPPEHHPVQVTVTLENGEFVPMGSRVLLDGVAEPLVVGHRGQLFIADLNEAHRAKIARPTSWCAFEIEPPPAPSSDEIPQLGPVICRTETDHGP